MYHLRLIKGRSYMGAVSATVTNPDVFTKDDKKYALAMKSGYFEDLTVSEVKEEAVEEPEVSEEAVEEPDPLAGMTLAQLREYAEGKGIDVSSLKKKDEVAKAIRDAMERAKDIRKQIQE